MIAPNSLSESQNPYPNPKAAFAELMHRESLQWTLLSPRRRRLLDKMKEAEILSV